MATWSAWLKHRDLHDFIPFPEKVLAREWGPTEEDRSAAWDLYTELRTRVSTQPLRYRDGDEEAALTSLLSLFESTRDLLHKYQRKCAHFAIVSVFMLNPSVRPFTSRWYKIKEAGRLQSQDDCRTFRHELRHVQEKLIKFQRLLGHLAEEETFEEGSESGFELKQREHYSLGSDIVPGAPLGVAQPDLIASETAEILKRRQTVLNHDQPVPANFVGLAISGGGIRSATIALGAVQRLAEAGLLAEFDYLSTVSGGGYIGAFISSYLNSDHPDVGPKVGQQPFTEINQTESPSVRHLRNHSKYLIEGNWVAHLRMVGQAAYGILTNILIILPIAVVLAGLTAYVRGVDIFTAIQKGGTVVHLSHVSLAVVAVMIGLVAGLAIMQNLGRTGKTCGELRDKYEVFTVWWLVITLVATGFDLLPAIFAMGEPFFDLAGTRANLGLSFLLPVVVGALAVSAKHYPTLSWVLMKLFWLSGPLAFVLFYLSLTRGLVYIWLGTPGVLHWYEAPVPVMRSETGEILMTVPWGWVLGIDVGVIVYSFLFLNVNMTSPHVYYRDQLASTYLLKPDANNQPQRDATQKLSDLCAEGKAPYHLINGALNLASSKRFDLLGRGSDFFLFSKHYCGSPILGYFPTKNWEALDGHLNLGTAVAISGAAAAPIMGMTSIAGADFYLAVLNVRLAYWLRDPNPAKSGWALPAIFNGPGPTYMLSEMQGRADETHAYVNVSDGGHLENLALYELLRRRCKFIVAIDGECDPLMTCGSLVQLMRFAEIDFGINITIDLSELRLGKNGLSKSHYALGKIEYGPGVYGFLLYIKSALTGNEPEYVLAYKAKSPLFPHESTAKQLYEEDQFEAYRALGYHAAADLFRHELVGDKTPKGMRDWFQQLANSLF